MIALDKGIFLLLGGITKIDSIRIYEQGYYQSKWLVKTTDKYQFLVQKYKFDWAFHRQILANQTLEPRDIAIYPLWYAYNKHGIFKYNAQKAIFIHPNWLDNASKELAKIHQIQNHNITQKSLQNNEILYLCQKNSYLMRDHYRLVHGALHPHFILCDNQYNFKYLSGFDEFGIGDGFIDFMIYLFNLSAINLDLLPNVVASYLHANPIYEQSWHDKQQRKIVSNAIYNYFYQKATDFNRNYFIGNFAKKYQNFNLILDFS